MHLSPVPRFFVRWIIRAVLVLLFAGVPAAVLYLREVGVGFGFKEQIANALSGPAYRVKIGRLSLDPFKGLIAQGVEVRDTKADERSLAQVERLVVSVNFSDLLARKVSIDHIELDRTDVSVPLSGVKEKGRLNLQGVSAQFLFLSDQLRISYFEGNVEGVKVLLSGLLQNPKAFHLERTASEPGKAERPQPAFGNIFEKLEELKYPGARPELRAELSGDLADLKSLQLSPVTFRSGPVVAPQWRIEGVDAEMEYRDGILTVGRLVVYDKHGEMVVSSQWRDRKLEFEVTSSVQPASFLDLLPEDSPARELKFLEAPQFEAYGEVSFAQPKPEYAVTGSLRMGKFVGKGVLFDGLSADFASRDGKVFVRDLVVQAAGGEMKADVLVAPDDFRMRLTNTIAPTVLAPLMGKNERAFLSMMEFKDQPYLEISVQGPKPDFAVITGEGAMKLGRTAMRNSWIDRAEAKISIADRAVTYSDMTVVRGKGVGTGTFIYDFGGKRVVLKNVNSTLSPVEVLMWADPKIADAVRGYRFRQAPKVQAEGMIHMVDPRKNDLKLKVQAEGGLDYDLLNRTLKFGRTTADVNVLGSKVLADVKSAKLMGGDVGVKAVISTDASDPTFSADMDVRRVDFAELTKLYFNYDDSKGVGSGKFKFTARFGQEGKMQGEGNLRVEDGHVFAIPILGPLSEIINKIIPGAGFQTAKLATADFKVGEGKISTKNMAIEGAGFSLIGYGDIFFMTDKMDMSVRINAKGIPGIVLFPVSKLFEYVSTGSVSHPEWRPKIIPRFGNDNNEQAPPKGRL